MRRFTSVGHRDKSEPFFIAAHLAAGDSVLQISVKNGPDLVVGAFGENHLIEVKSEISNERKDGHTRKSHGKLKPGQAEFAKTWKGGKVLATVSPVESLRQVGHTHEAIQGALWDAGLHWMMDAHKGPEPTAAQWKKCKAKKCEHAARPNYRPPRGNGVNAAAQAAETFAPPVSSQDDCAREGCRHPWTSHDRYDSKDGKLPGKCYEGNCGCSAFTLALRWPELKCQRDGCGHPYEQHLDAMGPSADPAHPNEGCAHESVCGCLGYIGMGPASLPKKAQRRRSGEPRREDMSQGGGPPEEGIA